MPNDRTKKMAGFAALFAIAIALSSYIVWALFLDGRHTTHFGAIAISQSALDYGTAWGYSDSATAAQRSIEECNKRTVRQDCVVRMSLSNNCGAMAMSGQTGRAFIVTDADPTMARVFAIAQCQAAGAADCTVKENFCASHDDDSKQRDAYNTDK